MTKDTITIMDGITAPNAYSVNDPGMPITAYEIKAAFTIMEQIIIRYEERSHLPESDPMYLSLGGVLRIAFAEVWRWARMYQRSGGTLELPQIVQEVVKSIEG